MATHRYRKVELGTSTVQARTAENGITYVKSAQPLQDYPQRMTDRLLHWAERKPEHTFIAKRDAGEVDALWFVGGVHGGYQCDMPRLTDNSPKPVSA